MATPTDQAAPSFDDMLQTFLVDLDGDGVPDAQVQAPVNNQQSGGGVLDKMGVQVPRPFFDPSVDYGPQKSEFNAPLFKAPAEGDLATLWSGDERKMGIPDPRAITLDGTKSALMSILERAGDIGTAAAATGGPPGAIIGNAARMAKNLPATLGALGENLGQVFAGGRSAASNAGNSVSNAATSPSQFVEGFRRGNVSPLEELAATWPRMADDLGGETAAWARGWEPATRPPQAMPVGQQITQQSGLPGLVLSPSRRAAAEGRRPREGTFIDQGGGYVAEAADPAMGAARRRALAADADAIDARMRPSRDARAARQVEENLAARRPVEMADAVVKTYMPQTGFREAFARDPMRVINDLETATGVSKPNLLSAMERAGFDLSFLTRDKFMGRNAGQMSGYYQPGGREAFQQIQESPVLYRQRSMHTKKVSGNDG